MSSRAQVFWSDELTRYDFGPSHPMNPVRLDLTMRLARDLGVLDHVDLRKPSPATLDELCRVHSKDMVEAVSRCSSVDAEGDLAHGLGTPDVPTFTAMHDVTSLVVGATLGATRTVWRGEANHAFSPAGGLHHAMPHAAAGFCVYNDVAVAISDLLDDGVERIAYVDVDVHHGDGVQEVFYDDPRVLTISLHQHPRTLYPGTGMPEEVGEGLGEGYAVNVALPPGIVDDAWLRALQSVVPHLLEAFAPQVLVSQHGCDSHALDPLANMALTVDAQRVAAECLHEWAHDYADGRWIATGGGGYAIVDVVPRTWTHVMAEMSGSPVDPNSRVPEDWRAYVAARLGAVAPLRMTDGASPKLTDWSSGYDPADSVDRSIMATRKAVFPLHGLDPERD
ncbi:MAG TPA: acetoin utilization protein AcuC [Actinomycetes bacterium]|nr:acetoin utilization protein AcuC [Actinomycetes bacterium]